MRKLALLLTLVLAIGIPTHAATANTLLVDPTQALTPMSQQLYGLFFEDINYAADGGLYAELLRNRSFENRSLTDPKPSDHFTGWMFNHLNRGQGSVERRTDDGLNENNLTYMRVAVTQENYRIVNFGYAASVGRAGVPASQNQEYRFFIWLRNVDFSGSLSVQLTSTGGAPLSDTITLTPQGGWTKYSGTLVGAETQDAVLSITCQGTGAFDMDMASLMPKDCFGADWLSGGLRTDLVEALKALSPRFLRFPGGCVAEGSFYKANVYRWKDTIGPVEQRRENENTWGYMQSYGLGFDEYFRLCEYLGAAPLPVVNANLICQARENRDQPYTQEEREQHIQDVLDLIEYANGDVSTPWGALRAQNGHPEPYHMQYLAIGNENWGDEYFYRYGEIRDAVKQKYPDIITIVAAGPVAQGSLIDHSWAVIRSRYPNELVDEHYYMDSDWFLNHVDRYDSYPRKGNTVFLGEYAAHEPAAGGKRPNNLYSALCEAAYLTGVERNADLVTLCCYAPLFARNGFTQWTPDMIWFDGRKVVPTPNYYIQQMFSSTLGESVVLTQGDLPERVYQVATVTKDCCYVKLVNVSGQAATVEIAVPLDDQTAQGVLLTGGKNDSNTFDVPDRIVPTNVEAPLENGRMTVILPEYSCLILTLSR